MSQDKLQEIYTYLKKYVLQKENNLGVIDYYELYDLDQNMSVEEIKKELKEKRIRVLFHTDQVAFIDDQFKEIFLENTEEIKNMANVFSDENSKIQYDHQLKESKRKKEQSPLGELGEKDLEIALETTIYKNGFYNGFRALQAMAATGEASWFTRENNSRARVKGLGMDQIREILRRKNIMEDQSRNLYMDYYLDIINKSGLKEQTDVFYKACLTTSSKYDVDQNKNQLSFALNKFMDEDRTDCFTNTENSREELENSNITKHDAYILMLAKIHSKRDENEKYSYANIYNKTQIELIEMFSEITKQEAIKQKQSQVSNTY